MTREGRLSRNLKRERGQACDQLPAGKAAQLSEPARPRRVCRPSSGPVKPPESGTPGHNEPAYSWVSLENGVRTEAEWSREPQPPAGVQHEAECPLKDGGLTAVPAPPWRGCHIGGQMCAWQMPNLHESPWSCWDG